MRKKLRILTLFVATIILSSCKENEEFDYTLFADAAPTEVDAVVTVAEDNSGVVTVAPTAVGASSFQVFFVGGSSSSEVIGRNKTVTNIYDEGEYTIKIIAVAPNNKTTEITKTVTVLRNAILNFMSGLEISETAREIRVTPTAEKATSFKVDFGDGNDVVIANGENVKHTYTDGGDYEITISASNPETGQSSENKENVSFVSGALPLNLSFDDALTDYGFNAFGGVSAEVVVNPNLSGTNEEETNVAAVTNAGNAFEGFTYDLPSAIDFSGTAKTVSVKVYFDGGISIPLTLQFVNGVNGERGVEVGATHTGSGWETFEFDFTNSTKVFLPDDPENFQPITAIGQYQQLAMFIDGPGATSGTFFLDDFVQLEGDVAPPTGPEFLVDFEDNMLNGGFDFGAPIQIIDNPFSMGINTSAKVLEIAKGGGGFIGSGFSISNLDLTTDDKVVTIKFYSTTAVELSVDLKEGLDGAREANVKANHTGSGWEELTLDFSTATKAFVDGDPENFQPLPAEEVGIYTQIVFIVDGPGTEAGTFYMDDIVKGAADSPPPTPMAEFLVDFEDNMLNGGFDFGAPIQIIDNPFSMGISTSAKVLEIAKGGGGFIGSGFSISNLDLTTDDKVVTIKFYSTTAVELSVDLKEGLDGAREANVKANHTGSGWEELTLDFSTATKAFVDGDPENFQPLPAEEVGIYTQIVFIVDGPGTEAGTFYMDDVTKL